jgi:hypothetical protein
MIAAIDGVELNDVWYMKRKERGNEALCKEVHVIN